MYSGTFVCYSVIKSLTASSFAKSYEKNKIEKQKAVKRGTEEQMSRKIRTKTGREEQKMAKS